MDFNSEEFSIWMRDNDFKNPIDIMLGFEALQKYLRDSERVLEKLNENGELLPQPIAEFLRQHAIRHKGVS